VFKGRNDVMSTIALHSTLKSRKLLEIEAWFQMTTDRINGLQGIQRSRDRWRHVTLTGQTRGLNTLIAQYLESWGYLSTIVN